MNNQPLKNQNASNQPPKRVGRARPLPLMPWTWLALVLILHMAMGLLLAAFFPPFWVWPMALGGTLLQCVMLAGPRALSAFKSWRILLARAATCLGTGLSVVALAIAVGYGGTNDIDDIRFGATGQNLLLINLGVLILTAFCSLLIAYIGDRLLVGMGRARSSLCVLSFCFLGLFFGGALGLAILS